MENIAHGDHARPADPVKPRGALTMPAPHTEGSVPAQVMEGAPGVNAKACATDRHRRDLMHAAADRARSQQLPIAQAHAVCRDHDVYVHHSSARPVAGGAPEIEHRGAQIDLASMFHASHTVIFDSRLILSCVGFGWWAGKISGPAGLAGAVPIHRSGATSTATHSARVNDTARACRARAPAAGLERG